MVPLLITTGVLTEPPHLPMAENEKTSKSKAMNRSNPRHQIKSEGLVVFSYNWSDSQKIAFKIRDGLRGEGYPIWIDTEQVHGYIYEQMVDAIEKADVVLMFMSPKYEARQNCVHEAAYAEDKRKRIIPIFTQKGYEPQGLCGMIAAGKLYFDFSNEESFDDKLTALIEHIGSLPPFLQQYECDEVQSSVKDTVDCSRKFVDDDCRIFMSKTGVKDTVDCSKKLMDDDFRIFMSKAGVKDTVDCSKKLMDDDFRIFMSKAGVKDTVDCSKKLMDDDFRIFMSKAESDDWLPSDIKPQSATIEICDGSHPSVVAIKDFVALVSKASSSGEPVKEDFEKSLSAQHVLSDMSSITTQNSLKDDMQSKDSSKVTYSQVAEDYMPVQTTVIIGIGGGCVRLGRCLIDIPANAITEYVYFTFTLIYKHDTKEDDVHQLRLTPILECTPSCIFAKPVKITLPTCYAPENPGVLVTPKTYNGTNWINLQSVACGEDYVISFNADSFCLKGAWGRKTDFRNKRVFFKWCANIQDTDAIINWTIVDGDVEAFDENLLKNCYVDVKPEQNLVLRMKCTNAEIEPACQTKIRSKELFRERTSIKRQFTIIPNQDPTNWQEQFFDYEICDAATGEIIKIDKKFTIPTSHTVVEDFNEASDTDLSVEEEALACASVDAYDKHKTDDNVYKILHQPKGCVLIISNINFPKFKHKKRGKRGEKECADMKKLFEALGCRVEVEKDLSKKEVLSKAKLFSKLDCDTDFRILFMMSHGIHSPSGTDTFLLSEDCKSISVSEIMNYFQNGNTTKKLKGKPIILLFQCCRGQKDRENVKFIPQHISFQETFEEMSNKPIEDMADILLGYATVDGRSARRGMFTNSIFEVFWKKAKNEHFLDMLTMVKKQMYAEGQLSEHLSRFCKKLYLFPCITPPNIADSIQE